MEKQYLLLLFGNAADTTKPYSLGYTGPFLFSAQSPFFTRVWPPDDMTAGGRKVHKVMSVFDTRRAGAARSERE